MRRREQRSPSGYDSGRWLLLGTALLQASAPALVGFGGDGADPPIVPPASFFAVWGVVVLGCVLAALWGLPRRRAGTAPYRSIQLPLSAVQLGFVAWLVAARSPTAWLTLPIFAAMLAGLVLSLRRVLANRSASEADRISRALLGGVLGVYAGWSTAAVWINAATLLPDSALNGDAGLILQCAFALAAAAAATTGTYVLRGQAAYTLTAGWALTGVTVSALTAGATPLAVTAVAGLLVVGGVALLRRRRAGPDRKPVRGPCRG
ncbi:hypothetical protein Daura_31635 [Dactylosporangium aurantiacum]|uniref:Uncharacterized protein n=1 Tax=Dactylosporangium aurantiacum TaxID=35754 RepID=A0A9Q9MED2_9ACTN|nr:hypothetical protein [Dactylosporangium aurantiacum]MDG6109548.1 hypothetical protein [Dactylosporangium aurantiacum]UWZ51295.1 hypothetical protein Daura_31635 [Dactylosporangium aurantiacum]